jgi:hypothetical protein
MGDGVLELRGQCRVGGLRQEEQNIDVGGRIEFAAAVATDGQKRQRRRQIERLPQLAKDLVHQAATLVQEPRRVSVGEIALAYRRLPGLQA